MGMLKKYCWLAGALASAVTVANAQTEVSAGSDDVAQEPVVPVKTEEAATHAEQLARKSGGRFVEEIIVTAQKRNENLQDVPISIQAFSADMLDARGIVDQRDLQLVTPGLDVGSQVGYTTIYLRGVGSDAYITADPSVASYIDGIYYPFAQGLAQDFGAVERVEVLKGPQGTLFGRNAVGGAVHVITRTPDLNQAEISLQMSYSRFNEMKARAYISLPLTDSLAFSISGIYNQADNFIDGIAGGKPLPRETSKGARIKLRWQPIEDLDIALTGFKLESSGAGSLFQLNQNPSAIGVPLIRPQTGYSGEVDTNTFNNLDNRVFYGQATYTTPWFDLKLLGSDQLTETFAQYDYDGSAAPLVSFYARPTLADVQSGEFQIISNADSWGADWLKWIGGVYYFRSSQGFNPVTLNVANLDLEAGTVAGIRLPDGLTDTLDLLSNIPGAVPSGSVELVGMIGTNSIAYFTQATASVTDWLDVTLGLRYQAEERKIIESSVGVRTIDGDVIKAIIYREARDAETNRVVPTEDTTYSFKPKVSIDLRPFEDDTLLYLSYQEALKSATYNAVAIYLRPAYVKPEELEAYEVGIKTSAFGGLMRFNAAAFQYDITNLQVQFISLLQGGAVSFENAGGARVRGIDFDTTVQLLPDQIDGLAMVAGAAYLHSEYTDYRNGTGYNTLGVYSTNNDYTGNRIVRTPKISGTLSLSKTWEVPSGAIELAGDAYYNSGFYYAASNLDRTEQKAYEVYGARVSYLYEPANFRITVFGRNLGKEKYTAGSLPTDFGNLVTLAPPLTYGVRLNWDF